jgi:hypothetical protein
MLFLTQEVFAPANARTRSGVTRLTMSVLHGTMRAALGLRFAKRLLVMAERQALFVST